MVLPYSDDQVERTVSVPVGRLTLEGTLGVPADARGVVLFAHGSGSSRFSPRNRYVARVFRDAGLATFLLDLLSPREEEVDEITRHHRFDIQMLADRLVAAVDWLGTQDDTRDLPIGLFGASTGGRGAGRCRAKAGTCQCRRLSWGPTRSRGRGSAQGRSTHVVDRRRARRSSDRAQ